MPSPIIMHVPSIAMKSKTLLAINVLSKNLPRLLSFLLRLACERLEFKLACSEERIPIFMFLQSKEYRANVPPVEAKLYKLLQIKLQEY